MNRIYDYITGYYRIRIKNEDSLCVLNLMMQRGIKYLSIKRRDDGMLELEIRKRDSKRLFDLCESLGIETEIPMRCGLPALLYRYRFRVGIPIGTLIFIFMLWMSTSYIWRIEVSGNTSVPSEKIIAELELLGCGVGDKIGDIDFFELCNAYIAASEEISWISVNLRGTVASVEVREQKNVAETEAESPSNIVASRAGQIESIGSYSGMCEVKIGEIVSEGQLLISGFDEDKSGLTKLARSSGYIMAYTTRRIEVSIPYKSSQKVYTGNTVKEKTINIFGKMIKLYKNTGNYGAMYDKIEDKDSLVLFDRIYLPFSVTTVSYNEYMYEDILLNEAEAKATAEAELRQKLKSELGDAELLDISINTVSAASDETTDAYTIICTAHCLEDIAKEQIIDIDINAN